MACDHFRCRQIPLASSLHGDEDLIRKSVEELIRIEQHKKVGLRYQRLRRMLAAFSAISGYSRFFRPEQATLRRQLTPKFQGYYVFPDRAS
jgi:hypothetical protein